MTKKIAFAILVLQSSKEKGFDTYRMVFTGPHQKKSNKDKTGEGRRQVRRPPLWISTSLRKCHSETVTDAFHSNSCSVLLKKRII